MTLDSFAPSNEWQRASGPLAPGLIFRAIPDSGMGRLQPQPEGPPKVSYPNCIVLPQRIGQMLRATGRAVWHPMSRTEPFDNIAWIVNICADPDEYASAMATLEAAVEDVPVPVFNHPEGIRRSRRDRVSELLQGIDGLIAPKCTRFRPQRPEDFRAHFEAEGFDYPVLVRPERSQTGQGLVRVEDAGDWDKIHRIAWAGKSIFMTQFVETAKIDGQYMRIRYAFVNHAYFGRSVYYSGGWNVHAYDRTEESIRDELAMLREVSARPLVAEVLPQIVERIRLNFFGIDLGLAEDGRLVLFEANAAMSILQDRQTPVELRPLMRPVFEPIEAALTKLLQNPAQWAPWDRA